MENTGHGAVKMDGFSSKGACVVASGFFGWVFLALIIGGEGPDIFVKNEYVNPMAQVIPDDPMSSGIDSYESLALQDGLLEATGKSVEYTKTSVIVSGLSRKNQVLYVQAQVEKPGWGNKVLDGLDIEFEQQMAVWNTGYHEDLHLICDMVEDEKFNSEDKLKEAGHFNLTKMDALMGDTWKISGKMKLTGFVAPTDERSAATGFTATDFDAGLNKIFRESVFQSLNGNRNVRGAGKGAGDGSPIVSSDQIQVTMIAGAEGHNEDTDYETSFKNKYGDVIILPVRKSYMVACGKTGVDLATGVLAQDYCTMATFSSMENETNEVRCCADEHPTLANGTKSPFGEWVQNPGCSVWAGSDEGFQCSMGGLNYSEAQNVCAKVGARLCTIDELENDCTAGTGCNHDRSYIWTNTPASQAFYIDFSISGISYENATLIESMVDNSADFDPIFSEIFSLAGSNRHSRNGVIAKGFDSKVENIPLVWHETVDKCAALRKEREAEMKEEEVFKVFTTSGVHTRKITCKANTQYCNPTTLYYQHYISHSSYRLDIAFRHPGLLYVDALNSTGFWDARDSKALRFNEWMEAYTVKFDAFHVSTAYTQFEMAWKYTYFAITLIATVWFFSAPGFKASCFTTTHMSKQQKWTALLLLMLLLVNDPFFAAKFGGTQTASVAEFLTTMHIIFLVGFIVMLMTFWLEIFESIEETNKPRPAKGTDGGLEAKVKNCCGARLVLALFFWIATTSLFCYERLNTAGDPMYNSETDMAKYGFFYGVGALLVTLYMAYLLRIIYMCFWKIRQFDSFVMMLFGITCLTIFATILGIYMNVLSPLQTAAIAFLGYYTIFNSYIWVLAVSYRASDDERSVARNTEQSGGLTGGRMGMQQLEEEDDEGEIELRGASVVGGGDFEADRQV
jgi:hypothetical protein